MPQQFYWKATKKPFGETFVWIYVPPSQLHPSPLAVLSKSNAASICCNQFLRMYADVYPCNFTSFWRHNSHAFFLQARLTLGERHEVVCDVARRLSEFAIQQKHYDRVRTRTHLKSHLHKNFLPNASETKCSTICTPFAMMLHSFTQKFAPHCVKNKMQHHMHSFCK